MDKRRRSLTSSTMSERYTSDGPPPGILPPSLPGTQRVRLDTDMSSRHSMLCLDVSVACLEMPPMLRRAAATAAATRLPPLGAPPTFPRDKIVHRKIARRTRMTGIVSHGGPTVLRRRKRQLSLSLPPGRLTITSCLREQTSCSTAVRHGRNRCRVLQPPFTRYSVYEDFNRSAYANWRKLQIAIVTFRFYVNSWNYLCDKVR